jgi:DNA-binding Lrp family transcriptional regulator
MNVFDALDYRILKALKKNARLSSSEIARSLHANDRTVRKRVERLLSMGAIRLTAVIEPAAFGYQTVLDVFLQVDPSHEAEVVSRLLQMPEIAYLAYGQGTHDLSIQARFKDNEEMREFLRRQLPAIPGVQITGFSLVPVILRNLDEWQPPLSDFK